MWKLFPAKRRATGKLRKRETPRWSVKPADCLSRKNVRRLNKHINGYSSKLDRKEAAVVNQGVSKRYPDTELRTLKKFGHESVLVADDAASGFQRQIQENNTFPNDALETMKIEVRQHEI